MHPVSPSTADPAPERVRAALVECGLDAVIEDELAGGASTRRFFRIRTRSGERWIAMYVPAPSQEIQKARQARGGRAFVDVQRILAGGGVRVPAVLGTSGDDDVVLVEDLGNDTLAVYLERVPDAAPRLYRSAVLDLARAQRELHAVAHDSTIATRAFDRDLLRWEVDHFREWFLEARGLQLDSSDAAVFERAAEHLSNTIAGWPRGFVHRDFQSRNLMVDSTEGSERLAWIDFQDAMLGPRAYDLVALLTDSYQTFDRAFIEARIDDYCAARGTEDERERILYEFDFITVQRKLKDAGRFIFIERVNGNSAFLRYVDAALGRARDALSRLERGDPILFDLARLLDRVTARSFST